MKKSLRARFTDEEKNDYKAITLKGLKKGQTFTEIANHIGISNSMVSAYKRDLVSKGEITQDEIDRAVRESENHKKAKLEMRIIQLVNEGKKYREIEEDVGYGYGTIRPIIQKLEEEGKVKYKKAGRNAGGELQTEIDDELLMGLPPESIQKNLNIEVRIFKEIKKKLIAERKITHDIIAEKRAEKKAKDKERVYVLLLRGYSQREIISDLKYVSLSYVQELIQSLKDEGRITDEEIKMAKFENNEREIREQILKGLRNGYTQQEIADNDETGYLNREKVKWYKNKMVAEGLITEEEIIFQIVHQKELQKDMEMTKIDKNNLY